MKQLQSYALVLLLAMGVTFLQAQTTVKGVVSSADDGLPLIGATIQVKGAINGVVTDVDGSYEISAPADGILVCSYTGFASQEFAIEGRTTVNMALSSDVAELEEIVVTGTAAGQSKKTLSFSVGSIDEEMLTEVPAANLGAGLQGKVAGLRVNQVSGQPGQGTFFQIRSANSIANGQQPLIIVDGVFLNGSTLADLNPEDIEKVEVLKGSAGAALYGSQAANGVIQIFTKRGRNLSVGETKVVYRGEVGFSEEINRYEINNFTNLEVTDPSGPQPTLGNPASDFDDIQLPNLQDYQEDILFRNGLFQSNYIAVQGKSSTTNFLASAQRLEDEGIIQSTDGYTRNSFRANIDHQISDKFSVQVSSMYSTSEQDLLAPSSNGPSSYLATVLFLTPMFDLTAPNEEDGSPFDWDIDNTGLGTTNPLYDRANSSQTVNRNRILGNIRLNYFVNDWLSFNYSAAVDRSTNNFQQFVAKGYLSTNVPGAFFGPLTTFSGVAPLSNGGAIHRTTRVNNSFISRFNAIAQKSFGSWNTAIRGSFLYEDLTQEFNEGIGENLAVASAQTLDNAQSNIFIASEQQEIVAYSGFLVADIDYAQKYIFSALFRREGSSLFGPEERWANYYRGSVAYRLSEDIKISGIQEFKLRASIGTAGIRPTFEQRFETFSLINGTTTKNTLGNNVLTPAQSQEIELGVNINFLNAFSFEFSYSDTETQDQILLVPLSGAVGFTGQWRNAGTISADIYEASLGIDMGQLLKIRNSDFSWNINTTFDRVRQRISELNVPAYNTGPGIQQSTLFRVEEGISFGTMVGEVFATSLDQLADQEGVNPGDYSINSFGYVVETSTIGTANEVPYKLLDENGSPIAREIGDINPDFRVGISNSIRYKGLKLYTLFDWKQGGDIYNKSKQWLYRDFRHADVPNSGLARNFFGSNGLYNVNVNNNHFVEDGSFFMLREAALSYEFGANAMQKVFGNFIETMRFSVIGRNLFTITDYTGFHPDVTSSPRTENTLSNRVQNAAGSDNQTPNGDPSLFMVDGFNYPLARTFTFRLELTF